MIVDKVPKDKEKTKEKQLRKEKRMISHALGINKTEISHLLHLKLKPVNCEIKLIIITINLFFQEFIIIGIDCFISHFL